MQKKINSKLIEKIDLLFERKMEQVDFLSTALSISKSAAIRRLNGTVLFSYSEAVIVAQLLDFSLDNLGLSNKVHIDLISYDLDSDPIELSLLSLESYLKLLDWTEDVTSATMMIACNIIPYSCIIKYDYLYKFYLYKKMFQNDISSNTKSFTEFVIPKTHRYLRKKLEVKINSMKETTIIFDKHIVYTMVTDILYFKELRLIDEDDLRLLNKDLLEFIKDLENICISGRNILGNFTNIYISDIALDASCAYIGIKDGMYSQIQMHSLNTMITEHKIFCALQKRWISSVQRYSTLISEAGSVERKLFFDQQHKFCLEIIS